MAVYQRLERLGVQVPSDKKGLNKVIRGCQQLVPETRMEKPPLLPSYYLPALAAVDWFGGPRAARWDLLIWLLMSFFGWRSVAISSIRLGSLIIEEAGHIRQVRVCRWDDKTLEPSARRPMGLISFPQLPWL